MKVSVVETGTLTGRGSSDDDVRFIIDSAVVAEELGFHRFWISEHHGPDVCAGVPHLLAMQCLSRTSSIRIGAGGILLRHRSMLQVAEEFVLLQQLFGNRVDLGMAAGEITSVFRSEFDDPADYSAKIDALFKALVLLESWGRFRFDADTWAWSLGSSGRRASTAGMHGVSYCIGDFIRRPAVRAGDDYRSAFRASWALPRPYLGFAFGGCAASTYQDALSRPQVEGFTFSVQGPCSSWIEGVAATLACFRPDEVFFVDFSTTLDQRVASLRAFREAIVSMGYVPAECDSLTQARSVGDY